MLVNQGVLGVKLWTGVDADSAVMYETLPGASSTRLTTYPANSGAGPPLRS